MVVDAEAHRAKVSGVQVANLCMSVSESKNRRVWSMTETKAINRRL